ncbi:8-amino-7-oxononanoate synthase [Calderihabitans maritimus]|uniref:8-amino-7-ketopelargonate synthase n=1 Tax=Calderihabitans maritimus TaxID=1246530 RepID=A0A1Z5HXK0_9FIRM|nr:8-amino-7-oxononanoate synthase [Calderihabitans maritimus]GAW94087.1 8-amino-7-oxononanoate synthase [Calderihabitans maritimus]
MNFMRKELEELKKSGLFRTLKTCSGLKGPRVEVNGRTMLLMASNNYLGLAGHPRVVEAAVAAIRHYGTGAGASRLVSGNFDLHEALERELACFLKSEGALVFSSGYAANVGTISVLAGPEDAIFSDELNHASIIDGCRLSKARTYIYKHKNLDHLEALLAGARGYRRRLIVTDGVFSMDGDLAPLPGLVALAEKYDALLMVDDAHGIGVLGKSGGGTVEHFRLEGRVPIRMGTLSKALASEGGFVAGSRELIEYLRNRARSFIFSTALTPGAVAAARAALRIVQEEPDRRERLHANARQIKQGLNAMGYSLLPSGTPIIPVIIGDARDALRFSQALQEAGLFAPAIRPPTVPPGTSRIRLTVMATHSAEDIAEALEIFYQAGKDTGLI